METYFQLIAVALSSIVYVILFYFRVFHDLALQLLNECYRNSEVYTYCLITRDLENWNDQSCFKMMVLLESTVEPENSEFIAHNSCQDVLHSFWNGGLDVKNIKCLWLVSSSSFISFQWGKNYFLNEISICKRRKVKMNINDRSFKLRFFLLPVVFHFHYSTSVAAQELCQEEILLKGRVQRFDRYPPGFYFFLSYF